MGWMTFVLAAGATARLTRLIGKDSITFFFRDWLAAHSEDAREGRDRSGPVKATARERFFTFVEDMVVCPWCLSIWLSVPVAVLAWFFGGSAWFVIPALALTVSHVTGVVAVKTEE